MAYETEARIKIIGRGNSAIVIDLNDANFSNDVCQVRNPHMTLLYRTGGLTSSELYRCQEIRDIYFLELKQDKITFACWERYGQRSNLVDKESRVLMGLVNRIRKEFINDIPDRPLHVALRK